MAESFSLGSRLVFLDVSHWPAPSPLPTTQQGPPLTVHQLFTISFEMGFQFQRIDSLSPLVVLQGMRFSIAAFSCTANDVGQHL